MQFSIRSYTNFRLNIKLEIIYGHIHVFLSSTIFIHGKIFKCISECKCKVYKKHVRVFIKLLTNYDKLKNEAFPYILHKHRWSFLLYDDGKWNICFISRTMSILCHANIT